jgi:hypothetical protein
MLDMSILHVVGDQIDSGSGYPIWVYPLIFSVAGGMVGYLISKLLRGKFQKVRPLVYCPTFGILLFLNPFLWMTILVRLEKQGLFFSHSLRPAVSVFFIPMILDFPYGPLAGLLEIVIFFLLGYRIEKYMANARKSS